MATTLIRARVDRSRVREATKILQAIGLTPGDAVNMLFAKIVAHRGLPLSPLEEGYAYAASEYGLTPAQVDAADKRIRRKVAQERRRGQLLKTLR